MSIAKKLTTIAENVPKVYQAGQRSQQGIIDGLNNELEQIGKRYMVYASEILETEEEINKFGVEVQFIENEDIPFEYSNLSDAIPDVFDAGKKSQYDEFWDSYQNNGKRTDYGYAFYRMHLGWDKIFYPKYDMKPTSASNMFQYSQLNNFNLKERLEECGVKLDFSKVTSCGACFNYAYLTHLPELNFASLNVIPTMFYDAQIHTIDKIVLKSDGSQTFSNTFSTFRSVMNVVFEGVIGNDISFNHSTSLSKESLISIINALSSMTTGKTITFSKTAINNAFGINVDDVSTYPEGSEYYILRNSKSNWNFSYA